MSEYRDWWEGTRRICRLQLSFEKGKVRAWLCSTLAELELLGSVYDEHSYDEAKAASAVEHYCLMLLAEGDEDRFPVQATERQFRRYAHAWKSKKWEALARKALDVLSR